MPCVLRGRSGGIKNLFVGRKNYSTHYTMHSMDGEADFQSHILRKYYRMKYNREGVKYLSYADMAWIFQLRECLKSIGRVLA